MRPLYIYCLRQHTARWAAPTLRTAGKNFITARYIYSHLSTLLLVRAISRRHKNGQLSHHTFNTFPFVQAMPLSCPGSFLRPNPKFATISPFRTVAVLSLREASTSRLTRSSSELTPPSPCSFLTCSCVDGQYNIIRGPRSSVYKLRGSKLLSFRFTSVLTLTHLSYVLSSSLPTRGRLFFCFKGLLENASE